MERNLFLRFEYETDDEQCPDSVRIDPDPTTMPDIELILTANACVQALAKTHGLEQALIMITDAVCGKLPNGSRFDTRWINSENEEQITEP